MLVNTICPACGKQFMAENWLLNKLERLGKSKPCCSRTCAFKNRKHPRLRHGQSMGDRETKEYRAWMAMRNRCYRLADDRYDRYGGRGIIVCERWRFSFENFLADVGFAPSSKHSLGRIDNDGNYDPSNVEWQSPKQQNNNQCRNRLITAFNRTQTLSQWSDEAGLSRGTIEARLDKSGWTPEKALSEPKRSWHKRT